VQVVDSINVDAAIQEAHEEIVAVITTQPVGVPDFRF